MHPGRRTARTRPCCIDHAPQQRRSGRWSASCRLTAAQASDQLVHRVHALTSQHAALPRCSCEHRQGRGGGRQQRASRRVKARCASGALRPRGTCQRRSSAQRPCTSATVDARRACLSHACRVLLRVPRMCRGSLPLPLRRARHWQGTLPGTRLRAVHCARTAVTTVVTRLVLYPPTKAHARRAAAGGDVALCRTVCAAAPETAGFSRRWARR